jgi:hypothetical protein
VKAIGKRLKPIRFFYFLIDLVRQSKQSLLLITAK